jgi:signal transduction histidine kinase
MIVFMIAIMVLAGLAVLFTQARYMASWLMGVFAGTVLLLIGFMFYFAKSGGIPYSMHLVYYIHPSVQRKFQYAIVTLDEISRLLSAGRAVFMLFFSIFIIRLCDIVNRKARLTLFLAGVIVALANYAIYEPFIYVHFVAFRSERLLAGLDFIVRTANFVFLTAANGLLIRKRSRIQIPWLKTKFSLIFLSIFNLQFLFLLFGIVAPLQVSYAVSLGAPYWSSLRFGNRLSVSEWLVVSILSVIVTFLGSFALWKYSRLKRQFGKPDLILEKKLGENQMGVRIFTHGMKNQMLAQKVSIRNLRRAMQENPGGEQIWQYIEELEHGNEQALLRMDDLYKSFKTNKMRLEPMRLSRLFQDTHRKLTESGYDFPIETRHFEEGHIMTDPPYLVQSLYNLLINAIEAVRLKRSDGGDEVLFNCYHDADMAILEIRDNGVGIAPSKLNRIFDPFFTQKNSSSNWGLGLSYVQQTVNAHYGHIRFESTEGEGTIFYVFLPLYRGDNGKDER